MQKLEKKPSKKITKLRVIIYSALLIVILACAGFNYWTIRSTEAHIAALNSRIERQNAEDDKKLAEIIARIAAEQAAAAKATADQATNADGNTASSVDSTTCNASKTHNNPASIDVVVNKKNCIQPVTYAPNDLVDIGGGFYLSEKAAPSYQALIEAAQSAGYPLTMTSSYRSYSNQVSTYAYWVGVSGKDGADTYSARPGYSEHQTGLAFDIASGNCSLDCFGTTGAYTWLQANAAEYGFIQRYYAGYDSITGYKAEEWHYRFVGTTVAKDMKAKNIKTLEEYWKITGGDYY